jgi:hypothetical protein
MSSRVRLAAIVAAVVLMAMLALPAAAMAKDGIQITTSADPESLTGSGDITYTYVLTNSTASEAPTASAIASITVTDDQLGDVKYESGDTNSNGQLDTDENWVYSATANLTATTTNVGTVKGTRVSDQTEVTDSNSVTVEVTSAETTSTDTTTVVGGEIPKTATPWYNVLLLGAVLIAAGVAGLMLATRRSHA